MNSCGTFLNKLISMNQIYFLRCEISKLFFSSIARMTIVFFCLQIVVRINSDMKEQDLNIITLSFSKKFPSVRRHKISISIFPSAWKNMSEKFYIFFLLLLLLAWTFNTFFSPKLEEVPFKSRPYKKICQKIEKKIHKKVAKQAGRQLVTDP